MRMHVKINAVIQLVLCVLILSGCWNYREINKMAIVTGVAIDQASEKDKYIITAEIIDFMPSGKETKMKSRLIESEGETIFDAVRSILNISGRRLYWSHAEIVIVSEAIAKDGLSKVLDLIYRDAEMRTDIYIMVSKEKSAREILAQEASAAVIPAYEIKEMLESQKNLGEAPWVRAYEYIGSISSKDASGILPAIGLRSNMGQMTASLMGTAVFKNDKLIGFLDNKETKLLLFVLQKFNRGILIQNENTDSKPKKITLEVMESKTKLKPKLKNGRLTMDIRMKIEAAIGETQTSENFIEISKHDILEKDASQSLQTSIKGLIEKVQNDFDVDIFNFQKHINAVLPETWKEIEGNWDDVLANMPVNIEVKVHLRNSALASKPIKVGEEK